MTNIPLSPDQRAARWGTAVKWLAFIVGGFLFAPIAMATITGMLGLIVAGAIAGTTYFLMPVAEQMATNLRLKMIKAEAAKNPIETLETEYLRRQLLLGQRKEAIETFDAKTRTFGGKLDGFKRLYPAEAPKYQATYDNMALLLQRQRAQWTAAEHGLAAFDAVIQKAKAMWDMALAAQAAGQGNGLSSDDFYAKLKTETALDSVTDGMNRAESQLGTLIMESDAASDPINVTPAPAALPAASGTTIDVDASESETVSIPAKRRART